MTSLQLEGLTSRFNQKTQRRIPKNLDYALEYDKIRMSSTNVPDEGVKIAKICLDLSMGAVVLPVVEKLPVDFNLYPLPSLPQDDRLLVWVLKSNRKTQNNIQYLSFFSS